jgi:hypothetical protein
MKPELQTYRPYGEPASTIINFIGIPKDGDTITVVAYGTTWIFTCGTDFTFPRTSDSTPNYSQAVDSFVDAVNGDGRASDALTVATNPCKAMFARKTSATSCRLISTMPGTVCNANTCATSNAKAFKVSATWAGGLSTSISPTT